MFDTTSAWPFSSPGAICASFFPIYDTLQASWPLHEECPDEANTEELSLNHNCSLQINDNEQEFIPYKRHMGPESSVFHSRIHVHDCLFVLLMACYMLVLLYDIFLDKQTHHIVCIFVVFPCGVVIKQEHSLHGPFFWSVLSSLKPKKLPDHSVPPSGLKVKITAHLLSFLPWLGVWLKYVPNHKDWKSNTNTDKINAQITNHSDPNIQVLKCVQKQNQKNRPIKHASIDTLA